MMVFICQQEIYFVFFPESIAQILKQPEGIEPFRPKNQVSLRFFRKRTRTMNITVASHTIPATGHTNFP